MTTRCSSQNHWHRSIRRHRTTPWMAGIGPSSIALTKAEDGWDWAVLDRFDQSRPVRVGQPERLSRRLAINQTFRALGIELQHPIPHDLQGHTADASRLR